MPLHGVLKMFGSIFLSSVLNGLVLLLFMLLCPSVLQLELCNIRGKRLPAQMLSIRLVRVCGIYTLCSAHRLG